MLNYVFLALRNRLNTIPELREVDFFANQYEPNEEGQVMYEAPACYIEFVATPTASTSKKRIQSGQVSFRAHIATEMYKDDDSRFTTAALDHWSMANEVYNKLLGYNCKFSSIPGNEALLGTPKDYQLFNTITRTLIEPDQAKGYLMLTIMTFSMSANDYSAEKSYTKVSPGVAIKAEIKVSL